MTATTDLYGMGRGTVGAFIFLALAWSLFWKGLALWRAAKRGDMWWFIAFLGSIPWEFLKSFTSLVLPERGFLILVDGREPDAERLQLGEDAERIRLSGGNSTALRNSAMHDWRS